MAKVMMDSEIVEALATLAAHGIEAMKVKPGLVVEDAQWDSSILQFAGPGKPFEFNKIKGDIKAFSDAELRMELLRRGHQVQELGTYVKYGPLSDDEIKNSLWSPQAGCAHDISIGIARDILTRFARSRGML